MILIAQLKSIFKFLFLIINNDLINQILLK